MSEGTTCYERDEALCEDQMCARVGCRLRNERLARSSTGTTYVPDEFWCGWHPAHGYVIHWGVKPSKSSIKLTDENIRLGYEVRRVHLSDGAAQQPVGCGDPFCKDPNCTYGKDDDSGCVQRADLASLSLATSGARRDMTDHTPGPWVGFSDQGKCVAIMPAMREGDICTFDKPPSDADARLMTAAPALFEAISLLEKAEELHANCDECDGEEVPELCPKCFPLFDDARLARRRALAAVGISPDTK